MNGGQTYPPFEIAVHAFVGCSIDTCLSQCELFDGKVASGQRLPVLAPPTGWNVLNGQLLCPRHKITIFNIVNGMPVVLKGIGL